MCTGQWALLFHANGMPKDRGWYYVSRVAEVDGKWWCLCWHPDITLRGGSEEALRKRAKAHGIELLDDVFVDTATCGAEIVKVRR